MNAWQGLDDLSVWLTSRRNIAEKYMQAAPINSRDRSKLSATVLELDDILKEVGTRMYNLEQMAKQSPRPSELRFVIKDIPLIKNARVLQVYDYRPPGPLGIGKPEWYDVPLVEDGEDQG